MRQFSGARTHLGDTRRGLPMCPPTPLLAIMTLSTLSGAGRTASIEPGPRLNAECPATSAFAKNLSALDFGRRRPQGGKISCTHDPRSGPD